jgi:hypothetical protein
MARKAALRGRRAVSKAGPRLFSGAQYEQAEPVFWRVLELRRRVLGENHLETLSTMTNLAVLYLFERKYEQSETLAREALKGFEKSRSQMTGCGLTVKVSWVPI